MQFNSDANAGSGSSFPGFLKAPWMYNTNVYEVNLRQYTDAGTINEFKKELPRLKVMGVETLWFMPLTPIAQKNKKGSLGSYYACRDYCAVDPEFGTLADFRAFVQDAHEMKFKVMIDWVANHTGWDHVWTISNPDFYRKDEQTGDFKMASGMDDIIELDFTNPALREAMINSMAFWIRECDIDGFRCDLAFWVTVDFWIEARHTLEKLKTLFWLAEADVTEHPSFMLPFDASYTWKWMHATTSFYKDNGNVHTLREILHQYNGIAQTRHMPLWFTSNHDENSWNGTEYEKYGELIKVLNVLSFTFPGLPMIYSGQEMPNHKRLAFFDKDVIRWNGHYQMQDFYSTLLQLKQRNAALQSESAFEWIDSHQEDAIIAYARNNTNQHVIVFLNFTGRQISFNPNWIFTGRFRDVFTHEEVTDLSGEIQLGGWNFIVYEKIV